MQILSKGDNYVLDRFFMAIPAHISGDVSKLFFKLADFNRPSTTSQLHIVRESIEAELDEAHR